MTSLPHVRRRFIPLPLWLLFISCLLMSCGREGGKSPSFLPVPAADEFSVMTYNLGAYGLDDRDGDGQKSEPKPASERGAVIALVAEARPDVLAVQEIGNPAVFEEFRYELKKAGLEYEHVEHLQRGQSEKNLAVLSRFPIMQRQSHTEDTYSIGEAEVRVLRGFLDVEIQVNPQYRFRLMVAHLKSKVFSALGQTEMRRNEARLLNKHIRAVLKAEPEANLLIEGDLNDTFQSAALREIVGDKNQYLLDPRPTDVEGDAWTHFSSAIDQYERIDYILVSRGMAPELVPGKTQVVRDSRTYSASDHRPIFAVFKAANMPAAAATVFPLRAPGSRAVGEDEE
jgi:endonuclease/exonuclease/phosphatase family metal-dependent hydrolase